MVDTASNIDRRIRKYYHACSIRRRSNIRLHIAHTYLSILYTRRRHKLDRRYNNLVGRSLCHRTVRFRSYMARMTSRQIWKPVRN